MENKNKYRLPIGAHQENKKKKTFAANYFQSQKGRMTQ
jgi:hypothetical protein